MIPMKPTGEPPEKLSDNPVDNIVHQYYLDVQELLRGDVNNAKSLTTVAEFLFSVAIPIFATTRETQILATHILDCFLKLSEVTDSRHVDENTAALLDMINTDIQYIFAKDKTHKTN